MKRLARTPFEPYTWTMLGSPSFLCPVCHTPLDIPESGVLQVECASCHSEVDVARLETLVGKPRFLPERCWTGTEVAEWQIRDLLGTGGMGSVYRAENAEHELCAVKFLSGSLAAEKEVLARFSREIAVQEKLKHEAIVRILGQGKVNEIPWFAMELINGPTLGERLGSGVLPLSEAREVFHRLLSALEHAHGMGVTHRDLKPSNVLLAKSGAKLADFGIAHFETTSNTTQLTRTAAVLGTFPYMSPEQRAGRPVDARSDLYSLGVMLYEALGGERPEGAFRPLSERRRDVRKKVDRLILDLLAPNPEDRIPSAREARKRLSMALTPKRPLLVASSVGGLGVAAAAVLTVGLWPTGSATEPERVQVAPVKGPAAVAVDTPSPRPEPTSATRANEPQAQPSRPQSASSATPQTAGPQSKTVHNLARRPAPRGDSNRPVLATKSKNESKDMKLDLNEATTPTKRARLLTQSNVDGAAKPSSPVKPSASATAPKTRDAAPAAGSKTKSAKAPPTVFDSNPKGGWDPQSSFGK